MVLRMFGLSWLVVFASAALAQEKKIKPNEFGIIFNMGYAVDKYPQDKEAFTTMVQGLKKAHFNVLLGKYTDERAAVCKANSVKIMVDLLVSDHHVYKNIEKAKAICTKLRGSDVVFAYHLWSDNIGRAEGRNRDARNVRMWDPIHASYVGSKSGRDIEGVVEAGVIGYYDFHWFRGGHWRHLLRVASAAKKNDAVFYRYCQADPGRIGAGNYNRVLYTISTSLAFGMKGYMFHYVGGIVDPKTGKLGLLGKDLARVNAEYTQLGPELMKIGNPLAVYSTPITKTEKDRPTGQDKPIVPAGLTAIPTDFWFQVSSGEALVGVFEDGDKHDVLFVANHNSYQPQNMELALKKPVRSASIFDRVNGEWKELTISERKVRFEVPPAAGEMVRFDR